ncbi:phosphoadenylyl-sulfate reductase [Marivita sp. XM-24bin2]|uniref:phosphoadenylyl-sulfate reductase n=1 Tax=unclassified Marivita TaxID=2632480 RepID=UPI000D7AB921|nr:phosphoadenylyl-sulfate reductase [Marivita sp. XM-24bin2]MCR9110389.1 phosphoadenylyl-sulfate reductase [Paracoccaceae bacterium]PWL36066.1 MAG: phosphoadenylyl-sulfate reductase [Marivita sp. XM-24bin2]
MLDLSHPSRETDAIALDERMAAQDRVAGLNARYRHFGTSYLLEAVLTRGLFDRIAMVSSFGADSAVLLHLIAQIDRDLPVLFIDTALLFEETLTYQRDLADHLGLTNVQVIRAAKRTVEAVDPYGALRFSNPDACCDLRKTQPLNDALQGYDAWITGRKRHQAQTRQGLHYFDLDAGTARIKINPLIDWKPARIAAHLDIHKLPRHPLVAKGYPSIGCAPCTTRVAKGEDPRAGRWRGLGKTECGLHSNTGDAQ